MTVTIICPITSRHCSTVLEEQPLFHALLPSLTQLGLWDHVRLVLGYDHDDPVWSQGAAQRAVEQPVKWVRLHGLTGSITSIWNLLERSAWPWEYLLPANDDLALAASPLSAVEALMARKNFGLVGFNDAAFPGLATFYVVHKTHCEIFGTLYPLPWQGAHQDSWIADVYRPWGASEIDETIRCRNYSAGPGPRFEYGTAPSYREEVLAGRRKINTWLTRNPGIARVLTGDELENSRCIEVAT